MVNLGAEDAAFDCGSYAEYAAACSHMLAVIKEEGRDESGAKGFRKRSGFHHLSEAIIRKTRSLCSRQENVVMTLSLSQTQDQSSVSRKSRNAPRERDPEEWKWHLRFSAENRAI